jgi:GWxTD domain-containing protein
VGRALVPGALVCLAAGCGNWTRVGEDTSPTPEQQATQMLDPSQLYTRLGRLVATGDIHYIGAVAYVPGPADSTLAIVGLSLSNDNFSFDRQGGAFSARYRVEYEFDQSGKAPIIVGRNETIRVATFAETQRNDESILAQQQVPLAPGAYHLVVRVRDLTSSNVGSAAKDVTVPAFGQGSFTAPILVYRVHSRTSRDSGLSVVLNPRGTLAFGGDTLLAYFEGIDYQQPHDVPVVIRDDRDSVIERTVAHFAGTGGIEGRIVRLVPDSAPLGQLDISVGPENGPPSAGRPSMTAGPGNVVRTTSAVVSFSDAWVVTNFDDLISLLRYFGHGHELDALKHADPADRDSLWKDFYHNTDPNTATPENEALNTYFARVAVASQRFREPGFPGWRTDRGEVYITLGEPDVIQDQSATVQGMGRVIHWQYTNYLLDLYFQDASGFGRFQLTPQSRADFERIRLRVQ